MPSITAISIYIFGLNAMRQGITSLLSKRRALASMQLPESALPAINGFHVVLIGIGSYYCLAAYQENRTFFAFSLGRVFAAVLFWVQGPAWQARATWEGLSGLLTGAALLWDTYAA